MEDLTDFVAVRNLISYICTGLSILGIAYIFAIYVLFPSIRSKVLFRIMANIAIADLVSVLGGIWLNPNLYGEPVQFNYDCAISGSIMVYGTMSSLFWTVSFALKVFQVIVNELPYERLLKIKWSYIICVLFPAALVGGLFIYAITKDNSDSSSVIFGCSQVYCYISPNYEHAIILVTLYFYIPTGVSLIANVILYYKIFHALKKMKLSFQWAFVCMFYPLFLMTMLVISSLDKFLAHSSAVSSTSGIAVLSYIHIGLSQIHGLFDAIIYGVNPTVKNEIKKYREGDNYKKISQIDSGNNTEIRHSLRDRTDGLRDDSEYWVK